ncbi:unnamed protein product [Rotaria socialis]|uniref:Gfo/Idh/MocA-like oxidoreductase N-terminal domain-containing protein n=4 Tax=Rotaria socialis TaxID=392032 RepID=A0A818A8K8_9BILA|nr:unnamed protein product [Rotaria socialis]CAF3323686.1 unnamed protein product [Rotaria socialis]CAF3324213.1 unnamed protein product [Rotaria socialis]CAF3404381.1 unnamed protein product [Rotaria socialis]CAF3628318.1 unnamed protein product [Rotaria socialis]
MTESTNSRVDVLMLGTGEYTTGYVHGKASQSDKTKGVVALTLIDLRRRGKTNRLGMCGTNGKKLGDIRKHMQQAIGDAYKDMDLTMDWWPGDDVVDTRAYIQALDAFKPGDACVIFTPDDTHFDMALEAIRRGIHVMITKPAVKTLAEHRQLYEEAKKKNVLVMIEVHKRFDSMYSDARDRIRDGLGEFSYFYSFMSQPKFQLSTFRSWAGISSDISYYLNSHHIDFHVWSLHGRARPTRVTAMGSSGVAKSQYNIDTEDVITLSVQWFNFQSKTTGTAVYTSSWISAKSDTHTQQKFYYVGHQGEINIDQAHRGYTLASDTNGYLSINPLYMKLTATDGYFSGQNGYGYRSFEAFIDAVANLNAKKIDMDACDAKLATIGTTFQETAVLEAGRISLDNQCAMVEIIYENDTSLVPIELKLLK